MSTQKHKVLVTGKDIGGFTIDPIRAVLYWTDIAERSIFWISFKQGYKETYNKNLLIKMEDEIPRAIAVDICKGYVYWTKTNSTKPTIERVRFDGTEKEVLIDESINDSVSLAIDQQTLKMFWADNTRNKKYRIFSTELDGSKTELISGDSGTDFKPNALTVSRDLIYLIDEGTHAVWKH
ncbi:protein cueball-like [Helicoverpa zea]|uniref:protein cueball-like n=1 Tax=Helicoverpa zea TaxID=7113 RepID=UPI001F580C77|nr:protein cueball-like [Helicoverpa zea]